MAYRTKWTTRLKRAAKAGRFSFEDDHLVNSWKTCAIGEKHHYRLKDWETGGLTAEEYNLGIAFTRAVHAQNVAGAVAAYQQIQELPA